MKLFGLEITRVRDNPRALTSAGGSGGWFNIIREPWGGAWQSNVVTESPKDVLAFSAVFACVTIIASDIAKLRVKLMRSEVDADSGVTVGVEVRKGDSPLLPVLKKPNHYQNRIKFIEQWVVSKLLSGNTYAMKRRDNRRVVTGLYILDPSRVVPLVAESGDVYYRLARDDLSGLSDAVVVPASEIIHDMGVSLWHPLVGVSPIYACGLSATMGNRIQKNSVKFFDNMSRPSGALTAPGTISDETANRMKEDWEKNFSGSNLGRLAVLGDGLKYEAMTIPAQEAQLIEQLKWTVEDVARCFHVPLYKLGGAVPPTTSIQALNQAYYTDCLQTLVESLELCLDEGLELPDGRYTELELKNLLRMDTAARYDANSKAVGGGWMSPNEARAEEDLLPAKGGNTPYLQQQNYSLEALAKRDAREDPFDTKATSKDSQIVEEVDAEDEQERGAQSLYEALLTRLRAANEEGATP